MLLAGPASAASSDFATGQMTVGTSPVQIVGARTRHLVDVVTDGSAKCYLGSASVTRGNGYTLQAIPGAGKSTPTSAALYAVCDAPTSIAYLEAY